MCLKRKSSPFIRGNHLWSSSMCSCRSLGGLIRRKLWYLIRKSDEENINKNLSFPKFEHLFVHQKGENENIEINCLCIKNKWDTKFGQTLLLPYFYFHSNRSMHNLWYVLGDWAGQEERTTIKLQVCESRSNQTCLAYFLELINCTMLRWASSN